MLYGYGQPGNVLLQPTASGGPGRGFRPAALPRHLAAVLLFGPAGTYVIELFLHFPAASKSLLTSSQEPQPEYFAWDPPPGSANTFLGGHTFREPPPLGILGPASITFVLPALSLTYQNAWLRKNTRGSLTALYLRSAKQFGVNGAGTAQPAVEKPGKLGSPTPPVEVHATIGGEENEGEQEYRGSLNNQLYSHPGPGNIASSCIPIPELSMRATQLSPRSPSFGPPPASRSSNPRWSVRLIGLPFT